MREKVRNENDRGAQPGSLAAAGRVTLLHEAGIWSQLWRQHSKARSSGWPALPPHRKGEADTDVSLRPSQPSVAGMRPSQTLAPPCGESSRRIVMTSHYGLGDVL